MQAAGRCSGGGAVACHGLCRGVGSKDALLTRVLECAQLGGALVEARPPAEAAAAVAAVMDVLEGALRSCYWCDASHVCLQASVHLAQTWVKCAWCTYSPACPACDCDDGCR